MRLNHPKKESGMKVNQAETMSTEIHRFISKFETFLSSHFALFCIVWISVFLNAWSMPLFDLDEGAFTEATREMLESGNFISTFLNGEPRHDKPILIYWFQALSVSLLGLNEFALRLPSCIASLAWFWVVYSFVKKHLGEKEAFISVWILATLPVATVIFKAAIADALLNLWLVLAFAQIYEYFLKPSSSRLLAIGLVLGLGFLTKGPVAVLIPIVSSFFLFVFNGKLSSWFQAIFNFRSILIFLVVIVPWHVAVFLDQGWGFYQGFYLKHNLSRFNDTMEAHGGSPFYYLILLPFLLAPFFGSFVQFFKHHLVNSKGMNLIRSNPLTLYSLVWFFLVLFIFSFSKTQLPHYLLYGMTPLVILIAKEYNQYNHKWHVFFGVLIALLLMSLPFFLEVAANDVKNAYEKAVLQLTSEIFYDEGWWIATTFLMILTFFTLFFPVLSLRIKGLMIGLFIMLFINGVFMPLFAKGQQSPVKEAALIAQSQYHRPIVSFVTKMPSFSVYANQIVPSNTPEKGDLVFTRVHQVEGLQNLNKDVSLKLLYKKGGIVLYCYGGSACE